MKRFHKLYKLLFLVDFTDISLIPLREKKMFTITQSSLKKKETKKNPKPKLYSVLKQDMFYDVLGFGVFFPNAMA